MKYVCVCVTFRSTVLCLQIKWRCHWPHLSFWLLFSSQPKSASLQVCTHTRTIVARKTMSPYDLCILTGSSKCVARNFGHDSVVCECNSTYCDSVGSVILPPLGQYSSHLSSRAGSRLEASRGQIQVKSSGAGEWRHFISQCVECGAAAE